MTAVAQGELVSPCDGTIRTFVAYTHDIEDANARILTPSGVCAQATVPGKS